MDGGKLLQFYLLLQVGDMLVSQVSEVCIVVGLRFTVVNHSVLNMLDAIGEAILESMWYLLLSIDEQLLQRLETWTSCCCICCGSIVGYRCWCCGSTRNWIHFAPLTSIISQFLSEEQAMRTQELLPIMDLVSLLIAVAHISIYGAGTPHMVCSPMCCCCCTYLLTPCPTNLSSTFWM